MLCWLRGVSEKAGSYAVCRVVVIVGLQVLGLRLGVDFTFTLDNNKNNDNNPHLNFFKGTVLGVKEQGLEISLVFFSVMRAPHDGALITS